jgi:hypothetical protein
MVKCGSARKLVHSYVSSLSFKTRDVSLTNSKIDDDTMVVFLQAFKSLHRFKYEYGGKEIAGDQIYPSAFGEGLAHLTHILEELVLTTLVDVEEAERIEPLVGFEKLRSVEISSAYLARNSLGGYYDDYNDEEKESDLKDCRDFVAALPPSLEHFAIRDFHSEVWIYIEELLV